MASELQSIHSKVNYNHKYEWVVVGSGIAGISICEILTREGHEVLLIEKDKNLSSGTSRDFHEWLHTGSLYSLIPNQMDALKYILGAIDDLFEYYSFFPGMNLKQTEKGIFIKNNISDSWFNRNYIYFKYRLKGRKITFPWLIGISRSVNIIKNLKNHDWLRRRAGVLKNNKFKFYLKIIKDSINLLFHKENFFNIKTTDFTMNSRNLINDLVINSLNNGLNISLSNEVVDVKNNKNYNLIKTKNGNIKAENVVMCCAENIKNFTKAKINTSYAPLAVISGLDKKVDSYVELDYFPKNCINILTKDSGIGLIGGITLNNKEKANNYINNVIGKFKKYYPNIKVEGKYIGLKNEVLLKNQNRNYLYHITQHHPSIWSIIPGKFSLAFSIAPEFYRQIYKKNPRKFVKYNNNTNIDNIISNTAWKDIIIKNNK